MENYSLNQHPDPDARRQAVCALENRFHPLVRELAIHELKKGVSGGLALGLFIKNYQDGDERQIIELAEIPEDADEQHGFFQDVKELLKKNPQADASQLAVATYALTPCSFCRNDAAELLRDRQIAPAWLMEECRFDSEPDTRKLFPEP